MHPHFHDLYVPVIVLLSYSFCSDFQWMSVNTVNMLLTIQRVRVIILFCKWNRRLLLDIFQQHNTEHDS